MDGGKLLSTHSVQVAHTVLRIALADAVEAGKVPVNALDRLPRRQRPSHTARQVVDRYWSSAEARLFLEATATVGSDRWGAGV